MTRLLSVVGTISSRSAASLAGWRELKKNGPPFHDEMLFIIVHQGDGLRIDRERLGWALVSTSRITSRT
jgi:hypothetical protein